MKKYVIAGAAGFLGSHLTKRLLNEGHSVIAVDNLVTGTLNNLESVSRHPHFQFIKHDIIEPLNVEGEVDFVCNLACPASPVHYFKIPIETLEVSSLGTKNMLDLVRRKNARFFHTSTSEVYGDPKVHPQPESYFGNVDPYCQRSCYDEGKRYAEALIYAYRDQNNLNTGVVRIFNTYGPFMQPDDGRVVSTFIRQALAGEDITVQSDGRQTRSFCYVDDMIEGLHRLIHSSESGPINIGNPGEFSVLELAKMVIALTKSTSKIVHTAPAPSDPKQRRPDIALAKEKLGWEPKVQLKDGLMRTIEWFKRHD